MRLRPEKCCAAQVLGRRLISRIPFSNINIPVTYTNPRASVLSHSFANLLKLKSLCVMRKGSSGNRNITVALCHFSNRFFSALIEMLIR